MIRFWEDKWLGENRSLKEKFPTLYQISNQQQKPISLLGSHKEEGWEWNFKWRRNLFDNEATMAAEFLEETIGLAVQQQGADSWVWKQDSSGIYSTRTSIVQFRASLYVIRLNRTSELKVMTI